MKSVLTKCKPQVTQALSSAHMVFLFSFKIPNAFITGRDAQSSDTILLFCQSQTPEQMLKGPLPTTNRV